MLHSKIVRVVWVFFLKNMDDRPYVLDGREFGMFWVGGIFQGVLTGRQACPLRWPAIRIFLAMCPGNRANGTLLCIVVGLCY